MIKQKGKRQMDRHTDRHEKVLQGGQHLKSNATHNVLQFIGCLIWNVLPLVVLVNAVTVNRMAHVLQPGPLIGNFLIGRYFGR